MSIVSEDKQKLIGRFQRHHKDTGSSELQVAILTERIRNLTDHFKTHPKDNHSRRGLILMVSRRKRLLSYMRRNDFERYTKTLQELELRK